MANAWLFVGMAVALRGHMKGELAAFKGNDETFLAGRDRLPAA